MSLWIGSLAFVLLMVILSSSVVSGQTQGMAIIANNPKAVGIGPFALGHVAFAYQNPSDGLFIFGSMEPTPTSPIAPSDTTSLNTKKEYTFDELKTFLANNGYTSYKAFYVDTPHVDAATAVEKGLTTKIYNVAASVTPPINNENCLTAAIKVLSAYGASLPDTNLFTITPNAYYATTPGKMYYPDFMGDDPVVPTSYQKPTEEAAVAGESGNQAGTGSNQPRSGSIDKTLDLRSNDFSTTPLIFQQHPELSNQSDTGESGNQAGTGSNVTLTLYFHNGDLNGPVIQGVEVTGQDGSGSNFQLTTDSRGSVKITGDPGTWSFSASADGYVTKPWTQDITVTCTKNAFLQKEGTQQPSVTRSPQQTNQLAQPTADPWGHPLEWLTNDQCQETDTGKFLSYGVFSTPYTRGGFTYISDLPVTLTLYIHNGDLNGPVIQGVEVTGQDGSGSNFQQTTDSRGSVIISGNPGTWSFSATAFGYQTKSWSQSISDTSDSHAYLQQVQQQESVPTTTPQGSESSVVGKWAFHGEDDNCIRGPGDPSHYHSLITWDSVIDFNNDGTFTGTVSELGSASDIAGKWVQSGDTIRFQQNPWPEQDTDLCKTWQSEGDTYEGTINGDTMSGSGSSISHISCGHDLSCPNHWSASRVGTGDSGNQEDSMKAAPDEVQQDTNASGTGYLDLVVKSGDLVAHRRFDEAL